MIHMNVYIIKAIEIDSRGVIIQSDGPLPMFKRCTTSMYPLWGVDNPEGEGAII